MKARIKQKQTNRLDWETSLENSLSSSILPNELIVINENNEIIYYDEEIGETTTEPNEGVSLKINTSQTEQDLKNIPYVANLKTGSGYGSVAQVVAATERTKNSSGTALISPQATGARSVALGKYTVASGDNSMAVNYDAKATGVKSFAANSNTAANGVASFAIGHVTEASGNQAVSFGTYTEATGSSSLAGGTGSIASGNNSIAFGYGTLPKDEEGNRIKQNALAQGINSIAIGELVKANGQGAIALGKNCTSENNYSFSGGEGAQALGTHSFAYGKGATASGSDTIAMGNSSSASGSSSIAFGISTQASGLRSAAFGYHNVSKGRYSFSAGNNNNAATDYATVFGSGNISNAQYQTIFGYYSNPLSTDSFVIGNGTNTDNRSNLLTLNHNGTLTLKGTNPTLILGNASLTEKQLNNLLVISGDVDLSGYQQKITTTGLLVGVGNGGVRGAALEDINEIFKTLTSITSINNPVLVLQTENGLQKISLDNLGVLTNNNKKHLFTTIVSENFKEDGEFYTQTISLNGISSIDVPVIDADLSQSTTSDNNINILKAWGFIERIETLTNSIKVYCSIKPTINIPIHLSFIQ